MSEGKSGDDLVEIMLCGRCPKCKRRSVRMKVEMFIDAPAALFGHLSKRSLRRGDVKSEGVRWENRLYYCERAGCGYMERL